MRQCAAVCGQQVFFEICHRMKKVEPQPKHNHVKAAHEVLSPATRKGSNQPNYSQHDARSANSSRIGGLSPISGSAS